MSDYLDSLFSLEGKVAVVIGGSGVLCGTMAQGLACAGAEVVLAGLANTEELAAQRIASIQAAGGAKTWFHPVEVTSRASLETLLAAVLEKSGRVDIVINGAGINSATPFLEISEEEWDRIQSINLKGVFLGCQVFGKHLVERGEGGSIINMGSISGLRGLSKVFTYSTTKAAVHNLSANLAREWAAQKVRVNTMVPGFFPAEQNRKVLTPERIATIMNHTPAQRFGNAEELVGATLLLASDRAGSFITGTEMIVDGGFQSMFL